MLTYSPSLLTSTDQFALHDYHTMKSEEEKQAQKQSALGDILDLLPMDLKAQTIAKINQNQNDDDYNCFTDKTKLKGQMVKAEKKFDGTPKYAGAFLNFLITTTADYNLGISEMLSLISANVSGQAYTWWMANYTTIQAQPRLAQIRKFIDLFKNEYMTQSHINEYETQLRESALKSNTIEQIDSHYKRFTEILLNLRLCKPHIPEKEVIHWYYKSLTDVARSFVTVQEMNSFTSLASLHQCIRRAASYRVPTSKSTPTPAP